MVSERRTRSNTDNLTFFDRYPECGTLTVTGGGTGVPSGSYLAAIPGVYSMSNPNVNINVYSNANQQVTNYTIPGPAVWTG